MLSTVCPVPERMRCRAARKSSAWSVWTPRRARTGGRLPQAHEVGVAVQVGEDDIRLESFAEFVSRERTGTWNHARRIVPCLLTERKRAVQCCYLNPLGFGLQ